MSLVVPNPAYDVRAAAATLPRPPAASGFDPASTLSATASRSRSGGPRKSGEATRPRGAALGPTNEGMLPAASAGARSGGGSSVGRNIRGDAADGGYMVVAGSLPLPGRLDSDVSLITDARPGRQESGILVPPVADAGVIPRRRVSRSEL